jgi:hypothetical protein
MSKPPSSNRWPAQVTAWATALWVVVGEAGTSLTSAPASLHSLDCDLCDQVPFRCGHRPQNLSMGFRPHMSPPDTGDWCCRNYNKRIDQGILHIDFSPL